MNRVLTSMVKGYGEEQNIDPTEGVTNESTGEITSEREGTRYALNLPLVIDNVENSQESDRMDVCETCDSPMSWSDYQEESNQDLESMEVAELVDYRMRPVVSSEKNIKEFKHMAGYGLTDNFNSPMNTQDENHLKLGIIYAGKFTENLLQIHLLKVNNLQNSESVNFADYVNYLMSTVNSPEKKQQELEAMDVSELTEGSLQDKVDSSKVSDIKSSKVSNAHNHANNPMDVIGNTIQVAKHSFESVINVNLNAFQDDEVDIINIYEDHCALNIDDVSPNIE